MVSGPATHSRPPCRVLADEWRLQAGPFFAIAWAISYPSYFQLLLLLWGLLGLPFPQWTAPSKIPGRLLQLGAAVHLVIVAVLCIPGVLDSPPEAFPWVPYGVPFLSLGAQYLFFVGLAVSFFPWGTPTQSRPAPAAAPATAIDAAPASVAVRLISWRRPRVCHPRSDRSIFRVSTGPWPAIASGT